MRGDNQEPAIVYREGNRCVRLLMVLSSFAPLFVLWAIQGIAVVDDRYLITACSLLVVVPTGVLIYLVRRSKQEKNIQTLPIGATEDKRGNLIPYIISLLLPFYQQDIYEWRELAATAVALLILIFLFWHFNYHYMNIIFAMRGYRMVEVLPSPSQNPHSRRMSFTLLTRRNNFVGIDTVTAYRISDTLYMEREA